MHYTVTECSTYSNKVHKKANYGFTLVEMSIVLVIIGLIIAGVLVGQDLVRSAQARAIITQIDRYNAAVNAFRNKFAAIPGDFPAAQSYLATTNGTINNGNGDGLIGPATIVSPPVNSATSEHSAFWAHLGVEGLVDAAYDGTVATTVLGGNFPILSSKVGGIIAYAFTDLRNYWHIGLAPSGTTAFITANNLSPNTALQIDNKTDDGLPLTGTILARVNNAALQYFDYSTAGGTFSGAGVGGTYCVNSTPAPAVYNSAVGSALRCQLRLLMM